MISFLDAAFPGSAAQFRDAIIQARAQGFAFYIGGDNVLNVWDPNTVGALLSTYPGMAIYVPSLAHVGAADGTDAVQRAQAYTLGSGFKVCLDIEPGIFAGNPGRAATYANEWCQAVRAGGFSPGVYGTPATVADCANDADYIWVAFPGQPDPDAVGLAPSFFPGKRMVQWGNGVFNGIHADVSNSQLPLGGDDMFSDADRVILDRVFNLLMVGQYTGGDPTSDGYIKTTVIPKLDAILKALPAGGGLTPAQAQELADILTGLKGLTLKAV